MGCNHVSNYLLYFALLDHSTSNNSSAIIGGAVGGVMLVLMITVVLCIVILCVRRCHQRMDKNLSYDKTKNVNLHPINLDVAINANPSYHIPTKPYSKTSDDEYINAEPETSEDEYIYVQPNNEFGDQKTIKMTTNPSYGVTTVEDTEANRPSHNVTTKEYDYAYATDDRHLHNNTANSTTTTTATTTGNTNVGVVDGHIQQTIHSSYLPLKSNGGDEYYI